MYRSQSRYRSTRLGSITAIKQFTARLLSSGILLVAFLSITGAAVASTQYEVTVTNLAHGNQLEGGGRCRDGQIMGLFVFATHNKNVRLFELGQTASPELALAAEAGFPYFLGENLAANPNVGDVVIVPNIEDVPAAIPDGIICTGESLTVTINANRGQRYLSLLGMMAPTNDAFVALDRVKLPRNNKTLEFFAKGYDAGSEFNDEICDHIPGLPGFAGCNPIDTNTNFFAPDPNPEGGPGAGEGYVHVHAGIQGIGDLPASIWDWHNPVAKVTIRKVRREAARRNR